jgi:hypothetical protein
VNAEYAGLMGKHALDIETEIEKRAGQREKRQLKKGSVQLPMAVWDYMDKKSVSGVMSVAGIVRGYVLNGIRQTLAIEALRVITPSGLTNVHSAIFFQFKLHMAQEEANIQAGEFAEDIFGEITDEQVLEYYKAPGRLLIAKDYVRDIFLSMGDTELIDFLGGDEY